MGSQPVVVEELSVAIESGDDPGVTWRTLTSGDRTPTRELTTGVCEIAPGGELLYHRHAPLELYYFLEGTGVVTLGGTDRAVKRGSTVYIPGDTPHRIRNDGAVPLRLFYVFPVDSFGDVEYVMLDPAAGSPP
jgi:mannose-6-phosphate isomerase-like protein (cupin superfamily)